MKLMSLMKAMVIVLAMAALGAGAVSAGDDNLTYQGNKARITVGTIKSKAGKCNNSMAAAIGEMLATTLVNSNRFIVLASQEELGELVDEIEFGQSEYAEEGRGPEKGLMEGADILITGAITDFEPDAGGSGGGLSGLKKKAFGKIGVDSKKAKIVLDLKIIDIRTRRILKAKKVKAESKNWAVDMEGGGWSDEVSLDGGLGVYSNEPMEKAIRASLAKSVEMIIKEVPDEYYRYQGSGQYTTEYGQSGNTQQTATATPAGGAAPAVSGTAPAQTAAAQTAPAEPAKPVAEDMTLYTKYDFVPGSKVLFYDDMSQDEEGEFPFRWNLERGVFEVVRMGGSYWIMPTDNGTIYPKYPRGPLPPRYTVELEFYDNGPKESGNYFYIRWVDEKGTTVGEFGIVSGNDTWLQLSGKTLASKNLPERLQKGVHTMRIMATTRSMKCYIDEVRVANVPRVEGFAPAGFALYFRPYNKPSNPTLCRGFRFAEGGKSMRDQLAADGRVVTHGILFDPDSYTIKATSYKTLKEIGTLLQEEPELRLSIEGHTDSDGADDHNLTLSQNRAGAVRDFLIQEYSIASDRLEAKGWGEQKPISSNDTPEGKANNRRVELVKL